MSFHRACRAALLVLFACAALPASLSALVVAIKAAPARLGVVSMSIHAGASRIAPQNLPAGPALLKAPAFLSQAGAISVSAPAVVAPLVRLHHIADRPKPSFDDPEEWEEQADFFYLPLERIFTGYGAMAPRRKIGFLRKGESEIFEPSPWGPRRKIGFLRRGESEFFESYPSP